MLQEIDFFILDAIQEMSCTFLDAVMPKITMLGNAGILWIALGLILCLAPRTRNDGILILLGLLVGSLICNVGLKPLVARERPCWIVAHELLINMPKDYSFPSGHTLAAFTAAFSLLARKNKLWPVCMLTAAVIAFSRLYLYVHFPSDVLFSVFASGAIAWGLVGLDKKYSFIDKASNRLKRK